MKNNELSKLEKELKAKRIEVFNKQALYNRSHRKIEKNKSWFFVSLWFLLNLMYLVSTFLLELSVVPMLISIVPAELIISKASLAVRDVYKKHLEMNSHNAGIDLLNSLQEQKDLEKEIHKIKDALEKTSKEVKESNSLDEKKEALKSLRDEALSLASSLEEKQKTM